MTNKDWQWTVFFASVVAGFGGNLAASAADRAIDMQDASPEVKMGVELLVGLLLILAFGIWFLLHLHRQPSS